METIYGHSSRTSAQSSYPRLLSRTLPIIEIAGYLSTYVRFVHSDPTLSFWSFSPICSRLLLLYQQPPIYSEAWRDHSSILRGLCAGSESAPTIHSPARQPDPVARARRERLWLEVTERACPRQHMQPPVGTQILRRLLANRQDETRPCAEPLHSDASARTDPLPTCART
jgi:hypothetical protein